MSGEGVRLWCDDCRKHVHNFARMRRRDIERAVAAGDCCGIVERRADGTLRTADPLPLRRRFLHWFVAWAGVGVRWAWAQDAPLAAGLGGIRGEVVDAKGKPVAGARVTASGQATSTDSDGRFFLTGLAPGTVAVSVDSHVNLEAQVSAGRYTTLAPVKLKPGVVDVPGAKTVNPVEVVVTDQTGSSIPTARVTLRDGAGAVVKELRDESSALGHYALRGVEPGLYTLTVECAGFKKYSRPLAAPTTQVVLEVGSVGGVEYIEPHPVRRLLNRLRPH
ncbi:MAG: carboxypeptidase regulatory-like domain-containing protein [Bryobacterales bacterium]|nr:carboxypeptidase regulatory-like domain-containing protein [Bryobacterales bacterium]